MARILIVDDEPNTVFLLSKMVEILGHEALGAYHGREALEVLEAEHVDLILLDLMMPEMDGYQTLSELRGRPETQQLPVVVVTASQDPDLEVKVRAAGGSEAKRKPVQIDDLEALIQTYVTAAVER